MDLRKANESNEQLVLGVLFYALVLTIVPLFPARYVQSLVKVARDYIIGADHKLKQRAEGEFGLQELL